MSLCIIALVLGALLALVLAAFFFASMKDADAHDAYSDYDGSDRP